MFTIQDQIDHELNLQDKGIARYNKEKDKLLAKKQDSKTQHGRALMMSIIDPFIDGVREIQEDLPSKRRRDITFKKLRYLDPEKVAYIALVSIVDNFSQQGKLTKVARRVGTNVELEYRLQLWLEEEKETATNVIKKANEKTHSTHKKIGLVHKLNKDMKDTEWTEEERIHVGLRLIDKLIVKTGIISLEKITNSRSKTVTCIKVSQGTLDWIRNFNSHKEKLKPLSAPCLIPPKPWDDVRGGGYYNTVMKPLTIVRKL